jgi:hypothetical protein
MRLLGMYVCSSSSTCFLHHHETAQRRAKDRQVGPRIDFHSTVTVVSDGRVVVATAPCNAYLVSHPIIIIIVTISIPYLFSTVYLTTRFHDIRISTITINF